MHVTHARILTQKPLLQRSSAALVPVSLLVRLALNQRPAVADLYYLRAVNSFGDKREHSAHYPQVQPLLWRASMLDAQFLSPYLLGGQAAAILGYDVERAQLLLRRGRAMRPESWQLPFYEGFIAYYWQRNDATAVEALSHAASFSDAPPQLAGLAATLAASAETPEVGLRLLEALLRQTTDERRRAELLERRDKLLLEVELQALGRAQRAFEARHKRRLLRLEELVETGLLPYIPSDPLGGVYQLDDAGRVTTAHQRERLRLVDDARATPQTHSGP